jgi:phosphoglycolate phosphatase
MRFNAVIFDLDGTLLDSLEDIAAAANQVLSDLGSPTHPVSEFKTLVGDGVGMLFQRALPACREDLKLRDECMRRFDEAYTLCWNNRSKPYDGIVNLLHLLVQNGLSLSVLSNKPDAFTKKCVEHFFGDIEFAHVLGHSVQFPRKPDPTSAKWIARQCGVASDRIAYVGDTNTDMKTAVGAGLFAIGVTWGFRSESELIECGAQMICRHVDELGSAIVNRKDPKT